jgi:hypothetical protein
MSTDNRFESLVNAEASNRRNREIARKLQADATAAENKQRLAELERLAREGLGPEYFWGPEKAEMCREFIEFAAKRAFAGSYIMATVEDKDVHGYPVGVSVPPPARNIPVLASRYHREKKSRDRVRDVYLGEDNKLWVVRGMARHLAPIEEGQPVSPPIVGYVIPGYTVEGSYEHDGHNEHYKNVYMPQLMREDLADALRSMALRVANTTQQPE